MLLQPALERMVEGRTQLDVPAQSLVKREPDTFPVFFNPAARINRDVSVALVGALGGGNFCDVMAGLGARGIRIAKESSDRIQVTMNDFNREATELARTNARTNGVLGRTEFCEQDANVLCFSRSSRRDARFDHIDIDPFGSPAQYVQSGISASREGTIISATATDTPVLCGVHPRVSLRRYGSVSRRNEFKHETGIRILLSYIARVAAVQDVGIEPVIVHSTRHYLRVFVRARHGAARADESIRKTAHVWSCAGCGRRGVAQAQPPPACDSCGAAVLAAGPVWTGALTDQAVVASAARACSRMGFMRAEQLLLSLTGVDDFPPYGFDLEEVCSRLRIPSVSREEVIEYLRRSGRASMRQPLESSGIKTHAEYGEIVDAVRSVAAAAAGGRLPEG